MKINFTRTDNKVPFRDVRVGSVFKHGTGYYMKIKDVYTMDELDDDDGVYALNAVSMSNGHAFAFDTSSFVEPVNHELIIKGKEI